jgi:hypothetical protein
MSAPEGNRAPPRQPSKLRLLRVFAVVTTVATYCVRHAGRLFVIAWFPCLIESASRLGLERLVVSPKTPYWRLMLHEFEPWLAAFVPTPWVAMAWAFILSSMSEENSLRGIIATTGIESARPIRWLRFELGAPIFIAAAIFSTANLIKPILGIVEHELLLLAAPALGLVRDPLGNLQFGFESSETLFVIWGYSNFLVHMALMALVMAWSYPLAGLVLRTGTFDPTRGWRLLRRNGMRLTAIFFLWTLVLVVLSGFLAPAHRAMSPFWAGEWTLPKATVRYVLDFPQSMLMIVVWAVTVGIVLDALTRRATTAR